ncbi:signal peptidase II [Clostridium estertheticum]|uniref:Signal peptidase II n=1 Tax=Clostridium estertheticum TaxID=238834 RepID=A0A5N7J2X8_9CLOT|nr:signal peptidase II [Clostridium estertheticum]MPQ32431.1 signal peptidase II [Clostridium estertheticum]MPQ63090.1 signal peptidase II [Clostridium estertheticum]
MSEFFNVTLDDVLLDDSIVSSKIGWSSEKILREIIDKRITKFEELSDVDVVNKKDKQIVVFSGDTNRFTTIDLRQIGDESGLSLKQISKMSVIGSPTVPKVVDIPINTIDFKVPRVNVLRFQLGDQNVIKTETSFNNGESNDFVLDNKLVFDGTVHLNNNYEYKMKVEEVSEKYDIYSVELDFSDFKAIKEIVQIDKGLDKYVLIKSIPSDRLMIPIGDMNLSSVQHIDKFQLKSFGKNGKIISSSDCGETWATWYGGAWKDINLSLDNVKTYGMNIDTFNSVGEHWNDIITAKKIRFAYLLQQDDIDYNESYDELTIQYDSQGEWIQAKENEYDVVYASNTLLQVKIYFSGDVKINY